ncbi:Outer membrane protein assembly factor BamB, contains PQQ-like beta-propeller repeat [Abditibacterium utsteinense]|uniref:Outer membrane protein assembly factor BamB, contains PQQ-like beta-propeller repeat n=1 Tax=Abditibacterium utsteinense TaxID=1960156 RepID=A0A2S8SVG5_9BACT|nr:PQQ-binding-like beta-propeller repeat protein [Abditibacterium utsteinense]PQV64771.1 Outer membrane protein assembly factor BamB, contains PQQ-like beta-propeller repeat [Abditibacterium utsteinense]
MRAFPRLLPLFAGFLFVGAPIVVPRAYAQEAPANGAPPDAGAAPDAPLPDIPVRDMRSWTTFKGDPQRTGNSAADVKLPLSLRWRFSSEAPSRTYTTSPLVVGAPGRQRAIFGAGRNVYALDMQTGAQVWKSPDLTSSVVTPLTLLSGDGGDLIITAQQGGRLAALRANDGGRVWEVDALSSISDAGPILVNTNQGQRIVVAVNAGRLLAFNLDGTLDGGWQVPLGRYGISPTSSMSLSKDGTLIFICGSDAKLYAIDARKGALAYSIQLAANSSVTPVVAGDQIITSNVRLVSAYKALGGSSIWNFDPRGEVIGSPSVGRDATGKTTVYFGTRNGLFYALDDTGAQKWKTDAGAGFTGSPLVLPSIVICGTSNGLLVGMDPSNGTVIWQYRLKTDRAVQVAAQQQRGGGRRGFGRGAGRGGAARGAEQLRTWGVSSAPTAIDGQLLVLGDNAALYSFTTGSFDADPPRVVEPSLALPDEQNKITSMLLNKGALQVPGRGPIYFAAQLEDTGSGVDPNSIKVTLDNVAIAADAINFQAASGILTITLLDPLKGGTGFPDGLKNINLTALDYAGNPLQYSISFSVENTATAPRALVNPPANDAGDDTEGGNGMEGDNGMAGGNGTEGGNGMEDGNAMEGGEAPPNLERTR